MDSSLPELDEGYWSVVSRPCVKGKLQRTLDRYPPTLDLGQLTTCGRENSSDPELYQRDADLIINTIFNEISEALARGDRVEIRGFGSFNTKETEARVGRNPKSGQKVPVEEKLKPVFRAGRELRKRINQE